MKRIIPDEIVYIHGSIETVRPKFEEGGSFGDQVRVRPAFVTDASNPKTIETGKKWAEPRKMVSATFYLTKEEEKKIVKSQSRYSFDGYALWQDGTEYYYCKQIPNPDYSAPQIDKKKNGGITNVRIINLEHRGNGGRAYKVIVDDNYYCDMREDVVLESMLTLGIEKNGIMRGSYTWIKYGAHTKLIREGSVLHTQILNEAGKP